MDESRNPILELSKLLVLMHGVPSGTSNVDVFARLFGCEPHDLPVMMKGIKAMVDLVQESKEAAEKFIPGDNDRFIVPLSRIASMLNTMNLSRTWSDSKTYLDSATMQALDFGGYALSQFYPAAKPENYGKIRDLVGKLNDLLEECLDSDLNDELKKLLTKHLEALRATLISYRLHESGKVDDAIDTIVGSFLRNQTIINEAVSNEASQANKEIFGKFFSLLGKVNDLTSAYQSASQLAAPATALLHRLIGAL